MTTQDFNYRNFFVSTGEFKEFFENEKYPWDLIKNIKNIISEFPKSGISSNYTRMDGNIYVGKNVKIDSSVKIKGGAIIGPNSTIGHSAYLRDGAIVSENVHIGHAVEIKHSMILSNTAIAHLNYVGDSIIGSNVNIAGGVIIANWRFDRRNIEIKNGSLKISTEMEKFGCIMGDNCNIGSNAVLNPGTILSSNSLVFPLVSVKGVHLNPTVFK